MTFSSKEQARELTPIKALVASGRYREALTRYFESADADGDSLTPQIHFLAGQAAARIGEFEISARLTNTARTGFEGTDDVDGLLETENLLGAIAFERGRMREAERHFTAVASKAALHQRNRLFARSANNLGSLLGLRGETDNAAGWFHRALDAYRGENDLRGMAESLHNLALVLRESGALTEARGFSLRSVELAEEVGEGGLIALTLLGRSELRIACDAFDEALEDIHRSELLAWEEGNEPHRLEAERLYALISLKRGNAEEAYRRASLVALRAGEARFAHLAAESRALMALALKAMGRHTEAVAALEGATVAFRSLGASGRIARLQRDWSGG